MDLLKKILNTNIEKSENVFDRGNTFYAITALVIVMVVFFAYICSSTVEMNSLADENASLASDVSNLNSEKQVNNSLIEEQEGIIKAQEETIKEQTESLEKIEAEHQEEINKITSENDKNSELHEDTLNEIMDIIGSESNSRSGESVNDKIDIIL